LQKKAKSIEYRPERFAQRFYQEEVLVVAKDDNCENVYTSYLNDPINTQMP